MRRTVIAFASTVSAVVLLFSYRTSTGAEVPTAAQSAVHVSPTTPSASTPTPGSGTATTATPGSGTASTATITGSAVSTRFGPVQVQITLSGTTITAATAVEFPSSDSRSAKINARAVPVLQQESVSAQSAKIDAVSGASYTSAGYVQSLQSALDQVHS